MGLFRLLILLGLIYLGYRTVKRFFTATDEVGGPEADGELSEMVQDPQCRTFVPREQAERRTIRGKTYFFCSSGCAERFQRSLNVRSDPPRS